LTAVDGLTENEGIYSPLTKTPAVDRSCRGQAEREGPAVVVMPKSAEAWGGFFGDLPVIPNEGSSVRVAPEMNRRRGAAAVVVAVDVDS